jgi:hypothetical protein
VPARRKPTPVLRADDESGFLHSGHNNNAASLAQQVMGNSMIGRVRHIDEGVRRRVQPVIDLDFPIGTENCGTD